MNIEQRVKKLESANWWYKRMLAGALVLVMPIVLVAANYQGMGDILRTPVEFRSASNKVVLRVDDDGVIEFFSLGRKIATLNGNDVDVCSEALPEHAAILRKVEASLNKQEKKIAEHEKAMKVMQRHVMMDKRVR